MASSNVAKIDRGRKAGSPAPLILPAEARQLEDLDSLLSSVQAAVSTAEELVAQILTGEAVSTAANAHAAQIVLHNQGDQLSMAIDLVMKLRGLRSESHPAEGAQS